MRLPVSLLATFVMALTQAASGQSFDTTDINTQPFSTIAQWPVSSEKEPLVVGVIEKKGVTWLEVHRAAPTARTRIGEWQVGSFPLNMMVTTQMDGYLVTEWVTGSGYIFKVFEYEMGKPRLVLDEGGKGLPDLILTPTKDYDFALIVRTDEQGVAARGGPNDTAAVYTFKHGTRVKKLVTAWPKRFESIAH